MTDKLTDEISRLEARKAKVAAELRDKKAQKRRQKQRDEERKKKLIGKVTLQRIKDGKFTEKGLRTMMDEYLERPAERELFGLPPRPKEAGSNPPHDYIRSLG